MYAPPFRSRILLFEFPGWEVETLLAAGYCGNINFSLHLDQSELVIIKKAAYFSCRSSRTVIKKFDFYDFLEFRARLPGICNPAPFWKWNWIPICGIYIFNISGGIPKCLKSVDNILLCNIIINLFNLFPLFSDHNCWSYLLFVISSRDIRIKKWGQRAGSCQITENSNNLRRETIFNLTVVKFNIIT